MLPITLWVWILAMRTAQPPATPPPSAAVRPPLARDAFAGVDACRPCHAGHVRNFQATAHWRTSRPATRESIVAPFAPEASHVPTSNPDLSYRLEANADGFFETAIIGPGPNPRTRTQRIDLVIGSGKKGQTYLWWRGNELFQLPLSYWTDFTSWSSNPGFTDRTANFTQPVIPRCLDCHATLVETLTPAGNQYKRDTALLGVSCEKCHRPAAAHVAARRVNARRPLTDGRDVVNPARLTRDQKVDLCASCHGGQKLGPPFSFLPGDAVKRPALVAERGAASGATAGATNLGIDSHGQQATALMNSRCFRASSMTCETCHDPHVAQRDLAAFSAKCVTCHKPDACGRFPRDGRAIVGKCVDCHMPQQPSGLIISTNARGTTQAQLRTHFIAVHRPGPR
jgi:hypothetical protein